MSSDESDESALLTRNTKRRRLARLESLSSDSEGELDLDINSRISVTKRNLVKTPKTESQIRRSKRSNLKSSSESDNEDNYSNNSSPKPSPKTPRTRKSSNGRNLAGNSCPTPTSRSSERLRQKASREFKLPQRDKALESISPGVLRNVELEEERCNSLRPCRLVNDFIRERNSYVTERAADCYPSGDSLSDFIDDDGDDDGHNPTSSSDDSSPKIKPWSKLRSGVEDDQQAVTSRERQEEIGFPSEDSDVPLSRIRRRHGESKSKQVPESDDSSDGVIMKSTQKRRLPSSRKCVITDSSSCDDPYEDKQSVKREKDLPVKKAPTARPKSRRARTLARKKEDSKQQLFTELKEKRKMAKLEPKTRIAQKAKVQESPETSEDEEYNDTCDLALSIWGELGDSDEYEKDFVVSNDESEDGMNSEEASHFIKLLDTFSHKGGNIESAEQNKQYIEKSPRKHKLGKRLSKWNRIVKQDESESEDGTLAECTTDQNKSIPLHLAILDDDINGAKKCLEDSADSIYERGPSKRTALHLVALQGNAIMMRILLRYGADRTALDKYGFPAIAYAANGHPDCLKVLLDRVDLKSINKTLMKSKSGMNMLHFAIGEDRSGSGCSTRGRCMDMLFSHDKKACVKVLERRDSRGLSPLAAAIYAGQHQCAAILLKYGANPNTFKTANGGNMLHFAVECASYLEGGNDFNNSLCLRQLLNPLKLVIDQRDQEHDFTPLMQSCLSGNADCLAALIDAGATVMITDSHKTSALHLAAMAGNTRCVQLLLDSGHPVDCLDKYGWPPLLYANFKAQESCVLALMKPKPEQLFVLGDLLKKPSNEAQKEKTFKVVKNALISLANHDAYYTVFNDFIRRNPEMLEENNHGLLQCTWRAILDFDNKRRWFRAKIRTLKSSFSAGGSRSLSVDRSDVLGSAMQQLARLQPHVFRRPFCVTFRNESGICTGPKKEFFICLCKDAVDPKRGLFTLTDDSQFSPLPNAYFARFTKDVGQKGVDAGKAGGKANFTTADQEGSTQTNIGGTVAAVITETSHSQTASGITECADNGCLTTRETASCSNEELLVPVDRIDAINADRSASIIPGEIGNNLGDQEADAVVAGSFRADSGRSLDEELIDICVVTSLVVAGTSSLGNRQAVEHVTENCSDSELMAAVMMEQEVDQELVSDLTPANRDNETIDSQENDGDQKTDNAVTRESLEGVFRRTDQGVSGMVDQGNSGSIDQQGSHASETMSLGADQATEGGDLPRNTNITQSIISETELHSSLHSSSVAGNPEDQEKTWMKCEEWNPETNVSVALRLKLRQLRLIGRLIGAAICDDLLLSLHLSKPFVKQILGIPLSHPDDLSSFDHELHSNQITWVQENSVDDLGFTFSIDATNPWTGRPVTIDLSENPDEELTDSNKSEYVKLVSQFKLQDSIAAEVKELAGGLNEVVPQDLLSFFTADEFSLLINGVSKIDVQDWRANTLYRGCKESDEIITWLWKTIASLKEEEKALLLKFSTGSPCVPIGGFAALQGLSGANKFTVSKIMGVNKIPEASTCFNLLKLTNYESEKQLREKLLIAIRHGSEGFSFA